MESKGGVTGGATITDFLSLFEDRGYKGSFMTKPGGVLQCGTCGAKHPADAYQVHRVRRVEGASDPSDMTIVAALECLGCHTRGTFTASVGAMSPPDDAEVLRTIDHALRPSREAMLDESLQDESLVADSGWLAGPREG
ncbi:MAG: hypothetical protein WDA16_11770 [Candidatus Thermoplasmatota archaeon]